MFSFLWAAIPLPAVPLAGYLSGLLRPEFAIALIYMGIGSCVIGFLLMTYASAHLPFAVYSATCSLSTIMGILGGVVFLQERFTLVEVVGTAVILSGVIGITQRSTGAVPAL